jgi:LacI family transcriptional regulator
MAQSLIAMISSASVDASPAQRGALAALRDTPHALCLFELEEGSPALLADLRNYLRQLRPGGVILLPPMAERAEVTAACLESTCNVVRLASGPLEGPVTSLSGSSQECELGYIDALAAQGLDRGAELVASSDGTFASGEAAARLLFEVSPRPTAILAASDELAAGALHAAHEQGIAVPRDLSIAGFGDSPIAARLWPALTSVRLPDSEMAFAAAIELIGNANTPPQPVEFFGSLVLAGSTGPVA